MKYYLIIDGDIKNMQECESRNSKRLLKERGGRECMVFTKTGKAVSASRLYEDGEIRNCKIV